jgi:acyl-CoA thioesterase
MTRLDRHTELTPSGDGRFDTTVHPGWGTRRSPNGGYLMVMLLRAMNQTVADATRPPRSLTTHFLRPAEHGPATIQATVERSGGKLTTVSARMIQNDKPVALAIGAFGNAFGDEAFQDVVMPSVLPPMECPRMPQSVEIDERFELRRALGPEPFSGGSEARIGGWSRLEEPRVGDALLIALLTDAWWPSLFTRQSTKKSAGGAPTVDLTVHFRAPLPHPGTQPEDFYLVSQRTTSLRDGYMDESGEVWASDGTLLAISRQHAVRV